GLIRLTGDFDSAEDALQEAYVRALAVWDREGIPDNPGAWLNTVSRRIAIDQIRRARASQTAAPAATPSRGLGILGEVSASVRAGGGAPAPVEDDDPSGIEDDRLRLLFVCCHPALSPEARWTLALRTLGGLTTREI